MGDASLVGNYEVRSRKRAAPRSVDGIWSWHRVVGVAALVAFATAFWPPALLFALLITNDASSLEISFVLKKPR